MYALSSIIKLLLIIIWSMLSIIVATLTYFLCFQPNVMLYLAKHMWARPIILILLGRISVTGKENIKKGEHYLIMANHTSYSDIPALFRAMPFYLHFIAKAELRKVPFLGWYMAMSGMIFIDRQNKTKSRESLAAAGELIKQGKSVVIYPEGTTSDDGIIAPFKKGGMHLAHASESTILPVRIKGTNRLWPSANYFSLRSSKVEVILGKPIPYSEYKDRELEDFLGELREQIITMGNQ